jgi:hypothetical protein
MAFMFQGIFVTPTLILYVVSAKHSYTYIFLMQLLYNNSFHWLMLTVKSTIDMP